MRLAAVLLACVFIAGCAQTAPPAAPSPTTSGGDASPEQPTAATPTIPPATAPTTIPPVVPPMDRLHWHGTVDVSSSMFLLPWETLTVDPGTVVRFHKQPDHLQ
ncbi:MAG: hypothetical protein LC620_03075, partial [Halobacteriales archaeon]|nr:hypothetical protein [Halobacteriales archaeon]